MAVGNKPVCLQLDTQQSFTHIQNAVLPARWYSPLHRVSDSSGLSRLILIVSRHYFADCVALMGLRLFLTILVRETMGRIVVGANAELLT